MKNLIFLLALLVAISGVALAQQGGLQRTSHTVFNGLTYANDDADTSGTLNTGGMDRVCLRYYVADTADIDYVFQTKPIGSSTWSAVSAVSADSVDTDVALYGVIVLREHGTNRIGGVGTQIRVIANFASSGNDSQGTATHSAWLEYKY